MNRFYSFGAHAVILWLLLVAREVYRARSDRRALTQLQIANLAILAVCLTGALIYFQHGARLSADGPHYFVQARSMLFDADLDFSNDYERVRAHRPIAERYPVGTALFSLPFLLVAHLLLLVGKTLGLVVNADGFGYSYETAFGLAGYFFGVLGLLAVLRITSQYVSVGIATLSLLTVWMSSFLVWYMVVEPSMPHSMSFAWTSFFLCFWLYKRPLKTNREWIVLGCLAGAAALVRWQNGALLLLPFLDSLLDSPRSSVRALWAALAAGLCFLPQLLFWQLTAGTMFAVPLAEHGVSWHQLSAIQVLYSTNRGLFPWNPVSYLGLIGLLLWIRVSPRLGGLFMTGFLLQILINSNVAIWWGGWSFGGRRFDTCVLFFVVGMAAFFQFLRRRPLVPIVGLCVLLFLWSYGLMLQLRRGDIPPDRLVSFRSVSLTNVREYTNGSDSHLPRPSTGFSPVDTMSRRRGSIGFSGMRAMGIFAFASIWRASPSSVEDGESRKGTPTGSGFAGLSVPSRRSSSLSNNRGTMSLLSSSAHTKGGPFRIESACGSTAAFSYSVF